MRDFQGRKTGGRAEGAGKLEQWFPSRKTPFPSRQGCIQRAWLEDTLGAMGIVELVSTFTVKLLRHSGALGQAKDAGNNDIKKQFALHLQEKMLLHLLLF